MTNAAVSDTGTRERRDFKIIDETDDYIVVDKPPLLLIHPTKPNGATTLWAELRQLLAFEIASGGQVSIVNRLDRETSGIVLVAKTTARGPGIRAVDAITSREQGVSRDCVGLAGLGNHKRRCANCATGSDQDVQSLFEADD